jgi:hypothetical protein
MIVFLLVKLSAISQPAAAAALAACCRDLNGASKNNRFACNGPAPRLIAATGMVFRRKEEVVVLRPARVELVVDVKCASSH